jgi:hypothetical protein
MFLHAASAGHLHILQWLHAQGYPWPEQTSEDAAESGDIALLQ